MRDAESRKKAEMQGTVIKLNKAEQNKVKSALESVENLKFKVKRKMATRRIVDLTANLGASIPKAEKPASPAAS